jgi:hypothetical protein
LKKETAFGIGSIKCKKDTAVLNVSLAPKLNKGLKEQIIQYTQNSTGEITGDGFLSIYRNDGKYYLVSSEETLVYRMGGITGKLAFYAMIMGNKNSERAYCWMCMLKKSQWNQPIHPTGEDMHQMLAGNT